MYATPFVTIWSRCVSVSTTDVAPNGAYAEPLSASITMVLAYVSAPQ